MKRNAGGYEVRFSCCGPRRWCAWPQALARRCAVAAVGKHTRHIAKPHAEIARRLVFLCALCGQARLEQLFGRKDAGGSYLSLELTTL